MPLNLPACTTILTTAERPIGLLSRSYRLMSDFAATSDDPSFAQLTEMSKVVFSSTLENPLAWANTRLVDQDPVEAVRAMKEDDAHPLRTIGSVTLCRSLLEYVLTVLTGPPSGGQHT